MKRPTLAAVNGPTPRRDLQTGLTVGAVLVPQSLAYAELAGIPVVTGLYAALAALLAYAVLGSSPHVSLGPTATSAILASAAAGTVATSSAERPAVLAATALLAGVVAVVAGLARLGFVANLLSRPVLTGYVAGAAVTIVASQLPPLLGIGRDQHPGRRVLDEIEDAVSARGTISVATVAVSVATVAALLAVRRLAPRRPDILLVVVSAIVVTWVFELDTHGIAVVGDLPRGLPIPEWPDVAFADLRQLVAPAAALALVGFAETIGQARTLGGADDVDANRELTALGAANTASGLVGGLPVSASFSRSALNARSGPGTRRADLVAALVIGLGLVAIPEIFRYLPKATLAAVVVVAVVPLVPIHTFRRLFRLQRDDFAFAVVAAVGVVVLGLLPGLALAVALSIGVLLYRVTSGGVVELGYVAAQDTWRRLDRNNSAQAVPGAVVLRFAGPLYFANAGRVRDEIVAAVGASSGRPLRVVLEARGVPHLDVTALDTLTELHDELANGDVDLVVAGLRGSALDLFLRGDLVARHGRDAVVYATVRQAVPVDFGGTAGH